MDIMSHQNGWNHGSSRPDFSRDLESRPYEVFPRASGIKYILGKDGFFLWLSDQRKRA